ncbi:MAG: flagellar basal body P-ring protein FlgI [Thermoguttaceae bacterium]|nr:flagellar basal body P-ring protein FlgI [Thermoguttaceae bacterium]MDW8079447.1 flagellar basal body P-ring protein FlgI [Thermoguttaceae bacterium]
MKSPGTGSPRWHRRLACSCRAWLVALLGAIYLPQIICQQGLAAVKLRNICRVAGQEDVTLQGLGLVTGLKGTGDGASALPTIRALATAMELLGNPVSTNLSAELRDAKNVALVMVTARVPASGARRGDRVTCYVTAMSAKSLAGGRLFLTPLTGPFPSRNPPVYAVAEGPITLDSVDNPTSGRVFEGCRFVQDIVMPFAADGRVVLLLHANYAGFHVAYEVASAINTELAIQNNNQPLARALDQAAVEVIIPPAYRDDVVNFLAQVLEIEILEPQLGPAVVIHERSGTIVLGGEVEIGPVVVTHKNMVIETGLGAGPPTFTAVDPRQPQNPKLKGLVEALNAIRVPPEDIVDIIKAIDRQGKLYGRLIIE